MSSFFKHKKNIFELDQTQVFKHSLNQELYKIDNFPIIDFSSKEYSFLIENLPTIYDFSIKNDPLPFDWLISDGSPTYTDVYKRQGLLLSLAGFTFSIIKLLKL